MEWVKKYRWLLLILLVAVGFRGLIVSDRNQWPASSDEDHWERMGLIYSASGILSADAGTYRPPLYPLMIALTYRLFDSNPVWVRVLQIVLSAATVVIVFNLGIRLSSTRTAYVAAGFAALYPLWAFFSAMIMAEILFAFLITLICFGALRYVDHPTRLLGIALGVLLGLSILCKPIVLVWVPVVLAWVWWFCPFADNRERVNQIVAVLCGCLVVVVPWMGRNQLVTGERFLISSNFGMNLLVGHEPGARGTYRDGRNYLEMHDRLGKDGKTAVERDRLVAQEVFVWIVENPGRSARLALRKVFLFWNSVLEGAPRRAVALHFMSGTLLCVFGIWGLLRHRSEPFAWLVWTALIGWTLVHAVFFSHPRFRLPIDILLMPFAASQVLVVWDKVSSLVRRRIAEL